MRYGVILLWEDDVARYRNRVERAEKLGFSVVGAGDSPNGYRELSVAMTVVAQATRTATIASMVTVPVGRHPVVTASSLAALAELSGDRIAYGVGTGGSATSAMGLAPTNLQVVRPYCESIRRLLAGEPVEWDGSTVPALRHPRSVPMYLSAYGPAARKLAGRLFDGVILAAGPSPDVLRGFIGEVRAAAEAAGRDPDSVDVWAMSRASVRDDRSEALVDLKANLASAGSFGLRSEAQMATVPEVLHDRLRELQRRYDATQHVVWDGTNAALIDELQLTDYLAERFAVVGTPGECREQLDAMAQAGVSTVVIPATDRDPDGLIERFAAAALDG